VASRTVTSEELGVTLVAWVELDSQHVAGQAQLGITLWVDSAYWRHQRVEAAFDNFRVSAPHMTCG